MLGIPFSSNRGRGPILFAGLGRVFHADDNLDRPINGLAIDLSIARWGRDSVGAEIGLQGNYRDSGDEELKYAAFYAMLRFGRL